MLPALPLVSHWMLKKVPTVLYFSACMSECWVIVSSVEIWEL